LLAKRVIYYVRGNFTAGTPSLHDCLFSQKEGKMATIVYLAIILVGILFAALSLATVQEHR
jgi:hypothetical protein